MFETTATGEAPNIEQRSRLGRVAFLTNFVPPYRKPVLAALAERCAELRVFVSTPMESNREWSVDWQGLDVRVQKTLTWKQRWRHKRVGRETVQVHVPIDTLAQLRTFRPEIVISVELGLRTVFAAMHRRMDRDSRLMVWADCAESTEKGRGFSRTVLRRLLRDLPDGFIVNGASGARYLRSLGVTEQRLFKVPYATDVARFGDLVLERRGSEPRRLLYVGQLIERKGVIPFLETLARWAVANPKENLEFVVAGDGPLRSRLLALAMPGNLKITLRGNVPYERLRMVYQECGIFVLPAFADTWALVVNEAMAAGLPVLGSVAAQAVEEMVVEGQSGWRFDPEDESSVLTAIDRCLTTSVEQLVPMRNRAHAIAMELNPQKTAELLAQAALACQGRGSS